MSAYTPAQAAAHAFVSGCVARGITASAAAVPPAGQLAAVRELWEHVAAAASEDARARSCRFQADRDLLATALRKLADDGNMEARDALARVTPYIREDVFLAPPKPTPDLAEAIRAHIRQKAAEFSAEVFPVRPQDMRVSAADILAIVDRAASGEAP